MKSIHFLCTVFFLSCFLFACNGQEQKDNVSANGEGVLLRFNLQKGKSYAYDMKIEMTNSMGNEKMESKMEFYYDVDVIDKVDSITSIKTSYRRVKMDMKMPNGNSEFDTDKPMEAGDNAAAINLMNRVMRSIIDKSFVIQINPQGEVVRIEGLKEMEEAAINSLNLNESDMVKAKMAFAQQFNEQNLKYSFSQAFNIYPNRMVKEGDTWEKQMSLPGMNASSMNTVFTVKDIDKNKIILESSTNMDVGNTKGTQTGTLEIDPETGLIKLSQMEQNMNAGTSNAVSKIRIEGREK